MRQAVFISLLAAALIGASATPNDLESPSQVESPSQIEGTIEELSPVDEGPEGHVARGTFATAIIEREPEDSVATLTNDQRTIYYFTELIDMTGQTILHRWEFNGQPMAEVTFEVGGPRWRVFSSKQLEAIWLGEWTASVIDAQGRILSTNTFSYVQAPAAEPTPAVMTEPLQPTPPASPSPSPE